MDQGAIKGRFNVYAKLQHSDGQIEPRRLWLENFTSQTEAEQAARSAVKYNEGVVLSAWAEPAPHNREE